MKPVRILFAMAIAAVYGASQSEARGEWIISAVRQIASGFQQMGASLTPLGQEPTDIKTMIDRQGLLKWVDPIESTNVLTFRKPDQPDMLGRRMRFITLKEALTIALENGEIDNAVPDRATDNLFGSIAASQPVEWITADSLFYPRSPTATTYRLTFNGRSIVRTTNLACRVAFEQKVAFLMRRVEEAYWNLQYGYQHLLCQEKALRFAYETWKLAKSRLEAGHGDANDVAQARAQFESFQVDRLQAVDDRIELELQLRCLLGMLSAPRPISADQGGDGIALVPGDPPTLADVQLDWNAAENRVRETHPELRIGGQAVGIAEVILGCFIAPEPKPLVMSRAYLDKPPEPTGVHALLGQPYRVLVDREWKVFEYLKRNYRRVFVTYELIRVQRATRESYAYNVTVGMWQYLIGTNSMDTLLEAQRYWCNAMFQEQFAVRDYNNALARFDFARSSTLERHNVVIAEVPAPSAPR